MRDDYRLEGKTTKIEIELEEQVAQKLESMSRFKELSLSEIANVALKRFIASHKDFDPGRPN
ncbi:MAG: hypothetical protein CL678_04190 [Bdellovibrionaceae bacterium]|nr:hypothetical protein [Pseudobdellovibrionaceae bacterium]|tara:strand:- start:973 stop:1158 length:186 start_codon:yes stop_codon:yes gene_type:complete